MQRRRVGARRRRRSRAARRELVQSHERPPRTRATEIAALHREIARSLIGGAGGHTASLDARLMPAIQLAGHPRLPNRFAASQGFVLETCPGQPTARAWKHRDPPRALLPPRVAVPVASSMMILSGNPCPD